MIFIEYMLVLDIYIYCVTAEAFWEALRLPTDRGRRRGSNEHLSTTFGALVGIPQWNVSHRVTAVSRTRECRRRQLVTRVWCGRRAVTSGYPASPYEQDWGALLGLYGTFGGIQGVSGMRSGAVRRR